MVEYPAMLPLDAAQICIEIVKNRQIQERKVEFAHAAWNVQGYAQSVLLGKLPTYTGPEMDEKFQELAEAFEDAELSGQMFGAENPEDAESVVVVLTIIGTIVQILSALGFFKRDEEDDTPAVG